jgi:hypothetical protein
VGIEPLHECLSDDKPDDAGEDRSEENPLRNAIPFVRGRSLRITTNVAVRTSGLAAAARA